MKLIINGVSVCLDKDLIKEIVFNDGEFTIINETKNFVNDEIPIINEISKQEVCVTEYTIDNPKLVEDFLSFEGKDTFTGVVKDKDGDVAHYLNGKIHRVDGPAIENADGDKEWWFHGKRHRRSGPAIEHANGVKGWWFNGKLHGHGDDFTNKSWIIFLFVNGFIPDYYH